MTERQWWAVHYSKRSLETRTGPYESREAAAKALFTLLPRLDTAMTGYGAFGPSFDIRWVDRDGVER